ncbi:helix-turn-helix domain-containing protein [Jeotgalicoccus sp. FSL K6-3177]|uniref:helix-turn-helix domain-containing protein n=1 Tax=Jeotgalicoccus sp. FSL K6-3177 TaxID=2921494 RepID=UPI0030FDB2EB
MSTIIANYRHRNNLTQQQVANELHVDKSYISRVESGQKPLTQMMYSAALTNTTDANLLNDVAYEMTGGHTMPTPSDHVYDGHRMSYVFRIQKEISEFMDVLHRNRLDKQPEHLTADEREELHHMISELQDVLFEGTGFVNRLMQDYQLKPQQLNQNRDAKLKMERRI